MSTSEVFLDSTGEEAKALVPTEPFLELVPDQGQSRDEWVRRQQHKKLRQPDEAIMQDVAEIDLLTLEEEIELGRLIQEGNIEARNRMVTANVRLAATFAQKYEGSGVDFEDLLHAGIDGLFKTAEEYDHNRGLRFSTLAGVIITQKIREEIARMGRTTSLPPNKYRLIGSAYLVENRLIQERKRMVTAEEIAREIGGEHTQRKHKDEAQDAADIKLVTAVGKGSLSLNRQIGDSPKDDTFQDMLVGEEEDIEELALANIQSDLLARALEQLSDQERQLITMIYGLAGQEPLSIRVISEALHINVKAIIKNRDQALSKLRAAAEN